MQSDSAIDSEPVSETDFQYDDDAGKILTIEILLTSTRILFKAGVESTEKTPTDYTSITPATNNSTSEHISNVVNDRFNQTDNDINRNALHQLNVLTELNKSMGDHTKTNNASSGDERIMYTLTVKLFVPDPETPENETDIKINIGNFEKCTNCNDKEFVLYEKNELTEITKKIGELYNTEKNNLTHGSFNFFKRFRNIYNNNPADVSESSEDNDEDDDDDKDDYYANNPSKTPI